MVGKLNKSPLWKKHPMLAQTREMLAEVDQLQAALRSLESQLLRYPELPIDIPKNATGKMFFNVHVLGLPNPLNLNLIEGWMESLVESMVGLWFLNFDMHTANSKAKWGGPGWFVKPNMRWEAWVWFGRDNMVDKHRPPRGSPLF